jgi:peptidoglycan/xylan/chitin deacetylase (PgdA/CDA1 family)
MSNRCSIVMYHYVRELRKSRFPRIKGLSARGFRGQLDYLAQHYQFVNVEQCLDAIYRDIPLPPRSVLLTFDDGFSDHFNTVFPLLHERGIQGCFFPPAQPIRHHQVLPVHKIHLLLASVPIAELFASVLQRLRDLKGEYGLEDSGHYLERLAHPNRFDDAQTVFVKRLLQVDLPEAPRTRIIDELFHRHVSADDEVIARELYLTKDQLRCMHRAGQFIGSHGDHHLWLGSLTPEQQASELDGSLDFLASLGVPAEDWGIAFPYGSYNDSLLDLVWKKGAAFALATVVGIATLSREYAFTLSRLDTNDLPTCGTIPANDWTARAAALPHPADA